MSSIDVHFILLSGVGLYIVNSAIVMIRWSHQLSALDTGYELNSGIFLCSNWVDRCTLDTDKSSNEKQNTFYRKADVILTE